ncbi:hypothetical protein OH76DRAFT_714317 [Lentinus brumalis]|uniref:Uncharacterized protein n=1 Tax=Lentinus brumalis TaxID=2498619 RepID=A0A371D5F7_9APHY|nr:hypothetical protein OH76DRAFT_714317 [Polyporus brumalis]
MIHRHPYHPCFSSASPPNHGKASIHHRDSTSAHVRPSSAAGDSSRSLREYRTEHEHAMLAWRSTLGAELSVLANRDYSRPKPELGEYSSRYPTPCVRRLELSSKITLQATRSSSSLCFAPSSPSTTMSTADAPRTPIRAIPFTLLSRTAPPIPPASQLYEPRVKGVLRSMK